MNKAERPYPGIRPFRIDESPIFFGREEHIAELKRNLDENNFVAVVGNSGSGKSSLVQAGLIPELMEESWLIGVFRPGNNPVQNLTQCINNSEVLGESIDKAYTEILFDFSDLGIVDVYKESRTKKNLLLVVDQFEEIFRYKIENNENLQVSIKFKNLLLEGLKHGANKIKVLITLRSEFLGRCSEFRGLPELINDSHFLMPRLTQKQLEDVVVKPLSLPEFDKRITSALVAHILDKIEDDPDQLPVLQHAMLRTWQESNSSVIKHQDYVNAGGMSEAIDKHAEKIYQQLSEKGYGKETKLLFQRLTEIDSQSNKVRNPTRLKDLVSLIKDKEKVLFVIDAFRVEGSNFLLPGPGVEIGDETMVDISHESLLRKWHSLDKWMTEELENKRKYAEVYSRRKQKGGNYLSGHLLKETSDWWFKKHKPNSVWASRYHLKEDLPKIENKKLITKNIELSTENEKLIVENEQLFEENEQFLMKSRSKQSWRTFALIGFIFFLLILGYVFAFLATYQKREVAKQRDLAMEAKENEILARIEADNQKLTAQQKAFEADSLRSVAEKETRKAIEQAYIAKENAQVANEAQKKADSLRELSDEAKLEAMLGGKISQSLEIKASINQYLENLYTRISNYRRDALKLRVSNISEGLKRDSAIVLYDAFMLAERSIGVIPHIKSVDEELNLEREGSLYKEIRNDLNTSYIAKLDSLFGVIVKGISEIKAIKGKKQDQFPPEIYELLLQVYMNHDSLNSERLPYLSNYRNFSTNGYINHSGDTLGFIKQDNRSLYVITPQIIQLVLNENGESDSVQIETGIGDIRFVEFVPNRKLLVFLKTDNNSRVIQYNSRGDIVANKKIKGDDILISLKVMDQSHIVAGDNTGKLYVWMLPDIDHTGDALESIVRKEILEIEDPDISTINSFCDSKNKQYLVTGNTGGEIRYYPYDLQKQEVIGNTPISLISRDSEIYNISFSPGNKWMVSTTQTSLECWPLVKWHNEDHFNINADLSPYLIYSKDTPEQHNEPFFGVALDDNKDQLIYSERMDKYRIVPVDVEEIVKGLR